MTTAGELYLGVDAGGTRTRAAVIDGAGRIVGAAESGPANPVSHSWSATVAAVATAALDAVPVGVAASDVTATLIGMAGSSATTNDGMAGVIADRIGLARLPLLVSDAVVAYAAGATEPDGCVLIAGTGATAARITGWRETASVDGHGWLLGDTGSAFWLGRAAARAALAAVEGHREPTALLAAVTAALLPAGAAETGIRNALIAAVHAEPPVALARLAPLVAVAAAQGDRVAGRIVADAVAGLAHSISGLRPTDDRSPLVVAGAVAGGAGPLGAAVRAELYRRWPGCVRRAGDTAAAAARLAARIGGDPSRRPPDGTPARPPDEERRCAAHTATAQEGCCSGSRRRARPSPRQPDHVDDASSATIGRDSSRIPTTKQPRIVSVLEWRMNR